MNKAINKNMLPLQRRDMIKKSDQEPKVLFESFVKNWFKLISEGQWDEAFVQIDLPPNYGDKFTPESFRNEIENDHFCENTVFRKKYPKIEYSDPTKIQGGCRSELYSPEQLGGFELEFDVPLNGEYSDLTSGWQFIESGSVYKVRLDWLHVL